METKKPEAELFSKELRKIEEELKAIWKLLSPSERQKRLVVQKMNRVQMTLHRLKFFHSVGRQPQAPLEQKCDAEIASQKVKRD